MRLLFRALGEQGDTLPLILQRGNGGAEQTQDPSVVIGLLTFPPLLPLSSSDWLRVP